MKPLLIPLCLLNISAIILTGIIIFKEEKIKKNYIYAKK